VALENREQKQKLPKLSHDRGRLGYGGGGWGPIFRLGTKRGKKRKNNRGGTLGILPLRPKKKRGEERNESLNRKKKQKVRGGVNYKGGRGGKNGK